MPTRLLITLAFPPDTGGMQSYAYQRCLHLGSDDVIVLAPQVQGWQAFDRNQPVQIRRWRPVLGDVPGLRRIPQIVLPLFHAIGLCRREHLEVIECWQPLPFGLIALFLKAFTGIAYIVWSHGNDLSRPQRYPLARFFLSRVLAGACLVIANSHSTRDELLALRISPDKIRVLNPPVDTRRFNPDIDCSLIRRRHDLEGRRVILTVARLVRVKGIDTVIRALPRVLAEVPDAIYLVVGDGPLRQELDHLAQTSGVHESIVFAGTVDHLSDDLPRYYGACDLFVMVSRPRPQARETERFGMAYVEAGACGKPVVGGRSGGAAEAVEDGITGLLVDPTNLDEVASAIIQVLSDSELAQRLGENARARIVGVDEWASAAGAILQECR